MYRTKSKAIPKKMQQLQQYLSPVSLPVAHYEQHQWGDNLLIYQKENEFPDLSKVHLAIIGVHLPNETIAQDIEAALNVRRELYDLYNAEMAFSVADLGNIRPCPRPIDAQYALAAVVEILLKQQIIPIIIGNAHSYCLGQYWGHAATQKAINVAIFDRKMDISAISADKQMLEGMGYSTDDTFLSMILKHPHLSDFAHLAHQRALISPVYYHILEKRNFDLYGLGELRPDIQEVEPAVRNRHLVAFDLSAIRQADAPATIYAPPAGLNAEEALAIARYVGLNDHLQSFGIYGYQPQSNPHCPTARLVAQMIWYFVEGFYSRKNDFPEKDDKRYLRYIVNFKDNDLEIVFLKSKKSDRWWMRVPTKNNEQGYILYPCSYNDYQTACHDEIPERWIKALLRVT